jgi:hypothetical protein
MAISNVSLWPFPGIWNCYFISFNDTRCCESVRGISANHDRGGEIVLFNFVSRLGQPNSDDARLRNLIQAVHGMITTVLLIASIFVLMQQASEF